MYEHIRCNFLPSRYLLAWLALLNIWVVALLWAIEIPDQYHILGWVLCGVLWAGILRHTQYILQRDYFFKHPNSIVACLYNKGVWQLVFADGRYIDAALHGESLMWYELIVLGFTYSDKRTARFLTIFPDSCDKNVQRQLRVQLQLQSRKQQTNKLTEKLKSLLATVKTQ